MPAAPLHGFRVLDACDELAVYATRLLAEMGAEVVRLEEAAGDPMRRFPPLAATPTGGALSLYYEHYNAGKRAVTYDRAAGEQERERVLALAAGCHALVESGRPGALLSAWLGAERLRAACPGLAAVSVTPFGREGPYAGDAGGDLEIAARAGLLWLSGSPEGPPYRPGGEQTAHMAGLVAANAALMGIFHAQRTGEGSRVEAPAVFAATLATLQTANANYHTWHGRVPARRGMGPPFARHIYPAADGWVALTALPGQWDNLVRLLEHHGAAAGLADPRYQDAAVRIEQAAHINAVLEAFTVRHPKQALFEAAQRAGVAAAPVNTPADLLADPFLRERGFFRAIHHPALGRPLEYAGPAARFAGRDTGPRAPAPLTADGAPALPPSGSPASLRSGVRSGGDRWLPLAGVRVLDFTWMIAGPLGTRLLANYGAEVLKVESYNRVDRIRETGPHPDGPWSFNEDGSFNDVNLGKHSILLNVNTAEGRTLAVRLAAVSDVVAANFTGNRMDRWHLGFDDLVRVRPDLIFLNMPVFHGQGERARWGGIGTHVNALAGINAISGFAAEPPFGLGPLYPDFSGNPFHATAAVLAALINRDRGAGAQMIELSQYESTVSVLGPALLQQSATGAGPARTGNHSDRACPHNVYPCAGVDRWCALSARTDAEFAALAGVLGRPEWAADPRFATEAARRAHEEMMDALIGAATRGWQREALAARLQAVGVAAAPVNDLADLLADPWYRAEYFAEIAGPEGCVFTTHAEPARPSGRKHPVHRAPLLGEHTDEMLRTLLGLRQPEIDALYASGALG